MLEKFSFGNNFKLYEIYADKRQYRYATISIVFFPWFFSNNEQLRETIFWKN